MGCDIHIIVEQKVEDKWIAVRILDYGFHEVSRTGFAYVTPAARERNYNRFAALAGVRGDGPAPLGLPTDASDTTRALFDETDDHSASYMGIHDAARIFTETEKLTDKLPYDPCFIYFCIEPEEHPRSEFRIVFWFDN